MKKIRVAFFGEDFSRKAKGTALVVQKLAEEFINNFASQIELAVIRKAGICQHPLVNKIRNIEIKVYPLPVFSTLISYLLFFISNKDEFDAVFFNRNAYPGFWFLNSKKFILILHDASISKVYREKLNFANRSFYWFLKHVGKHYLDAVIVDSEDARQSVIKHYRMDPAKVFAVYLAAGNEFRKFPESERNNAALVLRSFYKIEPPYILDVSRLDPHKNIETVVDAFLILKRQYHCPHKLVIVGGRHLPEYTKKIELKIAENNLQKEVVIAPYIETADLPAVYNLADVLVFPSLAEGFGLPVLEGMGCGVPVVTSNISSLPEVAGGAALLVDPRDSRQLAERVREALNNGKLRQELIARGLMRFKDFSWQKTAQSVFKLL